jgi:hypothetical protein
VVELLRRVEERRAPSFAEAPRAEAGEAAAEAGEGP